MKKILICIVIVFGCIVSSCESAEENNYDALLSKLIPLSDTIPKESVLAKYLEKNSLSVFVSQDSSANTAIKIIYSETGPVVADTLIRTGQHIYSSIIFPAKYEFGDCQVTETQIMKTVHPSSNWQGQTPGEKAVVYTYKNIK